FAATTSGDASTPGTLNTVGGLDSDQVPPANANAEELLFDVPFHVDHAGTLNLVPSFPADPTQRLFFFFSAVPVTFDAIDFGTTSFAVSGGPSVSSFVVDPTTVSPTNASLVKYDLTFSEPVTGLDSSDFTVNSSGLTGAGTAITVTPSS